MAISPTGEYIDYYGGQQDIDAQMIRAVGNPTERFSEDALRMIRAIRFAAQLGFTIEQQTLQAIEEKAESISFIAMERVQVELSKIWTSKYIANAISYMEQTKLVDYLPGALIAEQWANVETTNRQLGWAYFCFVNERDLSLLNSYRCSNKDKQFTKNVFEAYDHMQQGLVQMDFFEFDLEVLQGAYQMATWQGKTPAFVYEQIEVEKKALIIQNRQQLAVSGHDFMTWTDKKRGPWIKDALQAALEAVVSGQVVNEKQQLKDWFHAFYNEG